MAVSTIAHLTAFLRALEATLPPLAGTCHALRVGRFGSDVAGWQDRLCIDLSRVGPRVDIVIEEADLAKPVEQMVDEVRQLVARAEDEFHHRAAEFDTATGG